MLIPSDPFYRKQELFSLFLLLLLLFLLDTLYVLSKTLSEIFTLRGRYIYDLVAGPLTLKEFPLGDKGGEFYIFFYYIWNFSNFVFLNLLQGRVDYLIPFLKELLTMIYKHASGSKHLDKITTILDPGPVSAALASQLL